MDGAEIVKWQALVREVFVSTGCRMRLAIKNEGT